MSRSRRRSGNDGRDGVKMAGRGEGCRRSVRPAVRRASRPSATAWTVWREHRAGCPVPAMRIVARHRGDLIGSHGLGYGLDRSTLRTARIGAPCAPVSASSSRRSRRPRVDEGEVQLGQRIEMRRDATVLRGAGRICRCSIRQARHAVVLCAFCWLLPQFRDGRVPVLS